MTTPEDAPAPVPATPPAPAPSPAAKPKMKVWKKALIISGSVVLGLILILVVAGPAIIGSVARSKLPAILNEQLGATVTLGDVSFSWSGRLRIDDFRMVPKNFSDPLVEVKKVDVSVALGSAIGGSYIADVEVVAPKIVVEKGPDGKFNYEFPPAPAKPQEPKPKGKGSDKPPFVQATLKIRDGQVTIRGKGRETVYQDLAVNAKVDTLEKPVAYDVSLQSPAKDAIKVAGSIDLNTISGPATVTFDRVSLKNLTGAARAYSDVVELDGTVSGSLDYQLKGAPRFAGKGRLEIADFAAVLHDPVLKADQTVKLDRLVFTHDGALDEKGSGKHVISLTSGKALAATVTVDVADAFNARVVKTDLKVESDLSALTAIVRDTGKLPKGMALAGTIRLAGTCDSKGPTQADLDAKKLRLAAKVDLDLTGSNLDITLDGKPMKLDGFRVRHAGTLDENGTGKNTITLESGKALAGTLKVDVADAMGPLPVVKADLNLGSDLGELGKMLEKLIGLKPDMALEGAASVKGTVDAKGGESVKADLVLGAANLVAVDVKDKKRHEIDKAIELKLVGGWDGKTKTGTGVTQLTSSFATLDGKGGAALAGENPVILESLVTLDADLEKLAAKLKSFMEKPPVLGGKAVVRASAKGEQIGVAIDLKGLKYEKYGPFDAALKHEGSLDAKGSGKHTLRLESGNAVALSATADVKNAYQPDRAVALDLKMDSDLGALSAMLPGVVELKPGASLAGSVSVTTRAEAKGSDWARFDVAAAVDNLEAVEKGKRQEVDKAIRLKTAGLWDGKKQAVAIDSFALTSAFATADAKGGVSLAAPLTVKESSLQLKADLEKLGAKLGLFMADAPGLSGSVEASGSYAGERYQLDVHARGIKIVRQGKTTGPIDATVAQKGVFSMAKDGAFRIETGVVTSSAADLKLSGEIRKVMEEAREGEIKLEAVARPVELSKWMPDLGMGGPEIKLSTVVSIKPKLLTVTGQTKLDGLTMTSKDEKGAVVTKTAKTGPVEFAVTMKDPDLLATLKTPSFEWVDQGYAAKGSLDTQVAYNDRGTTGTTRLGNLEIVDDKKNVVKDPGLTIVHDIGLADQNRTIDLRKTEISSTFLKGTVAGRILRLDPAMEFQKVHLAFRYIPDKLGSVVQPWLPGKLEGSEEKVLDLTLDGKAASTSPLAVLRGTKGGIDLDLAKFTTTGVSVSGKTQFKLQDGKMVSGTPLQVNKGKTDLQASLDFNAKEKNPQSTVTFSAKDVDANGQMGPLLEKINPIFHTSGLDGKVDGQIQSDFKLTWTGVIDPDEKDWIAAASKSLSGGGTFGVKGLNIAGSPTVGQIMQAIGQGNAMQGEIIATQIRIANGRCEYENMTLRGSRKDPAVLQRDQQELAADRQQLEADKAQLKPREYNDRLAGLKQREEDLPFRYSFRFSGWVGFDKKMQLRVLMPMTPNMIKSHPNLQKYIGTSFWVDLTGTTESPRLDMEKMLAEAAKRAAEGILAEKAEDLLGRLFKDKKRESEAEKLFNEAQKLETDKNPEAALERYQKLQADYKDTEFVSKKKKAAIDERVRALQGK